MTGSSLGLQAQFSRRRRAPRQSATDGSRNSLRNRTVVRTCGGVLDFRTNAQMDFILGHTPPTATGLLRMISRGRTADLLRAIRMAVEPRLADDWLDAPPNCRVAGSCPAYRRNPSDRPNKKSGDFHAAMSNVTLSPAWPPARLNLSILLRRRSLRRGSLRRFSLSDSPFARAAGRKATAYATLRSIICARSVMIALRSKFFGV